MNSVISMVLAALLQGSPAPADSVLVARAVGPSTWRLESQGSGTSFRSMRLKEGQKIILIDAKGTREIEGPGDLLVLSKGSAKTGPVYSMAFRGLLTGRGPTLKAGVRGEPAVTPAKSEWEQLDPRIDGGDQ